MSKKEAVKKAEATKKALSKLKAMEALEAIENQVKSEETEKRRQQALAKLRQNQYKGNILSPGTNLTGISRLQYDEYIATVDAKVKSNWTLPEFMANAKLNARALALIDDSGKVVDRKIVKSSGNSTYDSLVLEAIDRSSPFPPPPEKLSRKLSVEGIMFGFPE